MSDFKHKKQPKKPVSDIDGFITSSKGSTQADIRRRFRQNYSPTQKSNNPDDFYISSNKNNEFETVSSSSSVSKTLVDNKRSDFNLQIESEENTKKRSFFRRGKKSGKDKKHRSKKKVFVRAVGALFMIILLGVGSILGYGYLKARQIFRGNGEGAAALQENIDPSILNGEGDGRVNILLLGKGGPGHEAPDLTDTILIASIDPIHGEAALISIPRDLYVQDFNANSTKINAIYSNAKSQKAYENPGSEQIAEDAGLKAIKDTVSEVLGVPIHYYIMVNFTAFQEAIDTVGGITVDVKEPLYDSSMAWLNNWDPLIADKGPQTFNGKKALMYARSRYGSARGDFDRTERQREVIVALQQKVLSLGTFSNPFKIIELMNTLGKNVYTDLNGTGELKRLYEIGQNITGDKFTSVGLADPPKILVTTGMIGNQSVVLPTAGLYQYDEIQSYIRNKIRDPYLKQENARVVILNGSGTAGLATTREKELKSYGYNIVKVDNAPTSDYVQTKLIDLSSNSKPFTASYLEKRLGITKSTENITGLPTFETADFVIILGSNEAQATSSN